MVRNAEYDAPVLSDEMALMDLVYRRPEWRISVYCVPCMRSSKLDPAELVKRLGPTATVGDLRARLRCRQCGRSEELLIKPALRTRRPTRG
jgi:hypothetical protein